MATAEKERQRDKMDKECDKQYQNKYAVNETELATLYGYNKHTNNGTNVTYTTIYGVVTPRVQTNQETTRIIRNPSLRQPVQLVAPIPHVDSDNARECLANALQCHIKDLVDRLLFSESDLADTLTSGGCLTDEENSRMRNMRCRKDQIRVLVYLIKGRDFKVMEKFIKQIALENPVLAKTIMNKFEKNKQDGIINTVCTLCKLIYHCDVKDVIDNLWGCQLIPDDLYSTICHSDKPVGGQYELWIALVQSLQSLKGKKIKLADEQLVNALRAKGVFSYLEEKVNIEHLVCLCKSKGSPRNGYSSASSSSDE